MQTQKYVTTLSSLFFNFTETPCKFEMQQITKNSCSPAKTNDLGSAHDGRITFMNFEVFSLQVTRSDLSGQACFHCSIFFNFCYLKWWVVKTIFFIYREGKKGWMMHRDVTLFGKLENPKVCWRKDQGLLSWKLHFLL